MRYIDKNMGRLCFLHFFLVLASHNAIRLVSANQDTVVRPKDTLEECAKACLVEEEIACKYFKFDNNLGQCFLTANSYPNFSGHPATTDISLSDKKARSKPSIKVKGQTKSKRAKKSKITLKPEESKKIQAKPLLQSENAKKVEAKVALQTAVAKNAKADAVQNAAEMLLDSLSNKYVTVQDQMKTLEDFQKSYSALLKKIQNSVMELQDLKSTSDRSQKTLAGHQQLLALLSHNLQDVARSLSWLHNYEQLLNRNINKVKQVTSNKTSQNLVQLRQEMKQFLQVYDKYYDHRLKKYEMQKDKLLAKVHQVEGDEKTLQGEEEKSKEGLHYVLKSLQSLADLLKNMRNHVTNVEDHLDTVEDKEDNTDAKENQLQSEVNDIGKSLEQFKGNVIRVMKPLANRVQNETAETSSMESKISNIQTFDTNVISQLGGTKKNIAALLLILNNMDKRQKVMDEKLNQHKIQSDSITQALIQMAKDRKEGKRYRPIYVLRLRLAKLFSKVLHLEKDLTSSSTWKGVKDLQKHVENEKQLIQTLAKRLTKSSQAANQRLEDKVNKLQEYIKTKDVKQKGSNLQKKVKKLRPVTNELKKKEDSTKVTQAEKQAAEAARSRNVQRKLKEQIKNQAQANTIAVKKLEEKIDTLKADNGSQPSQFALTNEVASQKQLKKEKGNDGKALGNENRKATEKKRPKDRKGKVGGGKAQRKKNRKVARKQLKKEKGKDGEALGNENRKATEKKRPKNKKGKVGRGKAQRKKNRKVARKQLKKEKGKDGEALGNENRKATEKKRPKNRKGKVGRGKAQRKKNRKVARKQLKKEKGKDGEALGNENRKATEKKRPKNRKGKVGRGKAQRKKNRKVARKQLKKEKGKDGEALGNENRKATEKKRPKNRKDKVGRGKAQRKKNRKVARKQLKKEKGKDGEALGNENRKATGKKQPKNRKDKVGRGKAQRKKNRKVARKQLQKNKIPNNVQRRNRKTALKQQKQRGNGKKKFVKDAKKQKNQLRSLKQSSDKATRKKQKRMKNMRKKIDKQATKQQNKRKIQKRSTANSPKQQNQVQNRTKKIIKISRQQQNLNNELAYRKQQEQKQNLEKELRQLALSLQVQLDNIQRNVPTITSRKQQRQMQNTDKKISKDDGKKQKQINNDPAAEKGQKQKQNSKKEISTDAMKKQKQISNIKGVAGKQEKGKQKMEKKSIKDEWKNQKQVKKVPKKRHCCDEEARETKAKHEKRNQQRFYEQAEANQ